MKALVEAEAGPVVELLNNELTQSSLNRSGSSRKLFQVSC